MNDVLITGMARSGTSLACALLNCAPNCVALVEPMPIPAHGDKARAVDEVVAFMASQRELLLTRGIARSAHVAGRIPDNTFGDPSADGRLRVAHSRVEEVGIAKPLDRSFRLFIKHPAMFTSLCEDLSQRLPLHAVVRHPLAALASWQTVDIAIRNGRWPVAEIYAPDLRALLDGVEDRVARQVALIGWIFRRYARLPRSRILLYEDMIARPAAALAHLAGGEMNIDHPIKHFEIADRYESVDLRLLARHLVEIEPEVSVFYPDFGDSLSSYL